MPDEYVATFSCGQLKILVPYLDPAEVPEVEKFIKLVMNHVKRNAKAKPVAPPAGGDEGGDEAAS